MHISYFYVCLGFLLAAEETRASEIRKLGFRESNFPILKALLWIAVFWWEWSFFDFKSSLILLRCCFTNFLKIKTFVSDFPNIVYTSQLRPGSTITPWNKSTLIMFISLSATSQESLFEFSML